jgi:hypothetical protein
VKMKKSICFDDRGKDEEYTRTLFCRKLFLKSCLLINHHLLGEEEQRA